MNQLLKNKDLLIEKGYLKETKHPTELRYIYNYTQLAQFDSAWFQYPELLHCRGLILDYNHNIIAKPFCKFFNFEEYGQGSKLGEIPEYKSFEITEKMDGSLGIMYATSSGYAIATRGSFTSEQALWATEFLNDKYKDFVKAVELNPKYITATFLFEIIYPENRIVVNYGDMRDLVLLTVIDTATYEDWPLSEVYHVAGEFGLSVVENYNGIDQFEQVRDKIKNSNAEGFVVKFDNGLRVKLKYEEYVRLHRIVTGISSKSIWDMLRNKQDFAEILEAVPDEFHKFVDDTRKELTKKWEKILADASNAMAETALFPLRKNKAIYIMSRYKDISGVVFSLLDGRVDRAEDTAWRMVEPVYSQPFKTGD